MIFQLNFVHHSLAKWKQSSCNALLVLNKVNYIFDLLDGGTLYSSLSEDQLIFDMYAPQYRIFISITRWYYCFKIIHNFACNLDHPHQEQPGDFHPKLHIILHQCPHAYFESVCVLEMSLWEVTSYFALCHAFYDRQSNKNLVNNFF